MLIDLDTSSDEEHSQIWQPRSISLESSRMLDSYAYMGQVKAQIVGVRYYDGVVSTREIVQLRREPSNPYDPNAVQVLNQYSEQVGHIRRQLAGAIASLMDEHTIHVEALVPSGSRNHYIIPLVVSFYGDEHVRQRLVSSLSRNGYKLESKILPSKSLNKYSGGEIVKVDINKLQSDLEVVLEDSAKKVSKNFGNVNISSAIITKLYQHQLEAVAWMMHLENSTNLPPLWKQEGSTFKNIVTNFVKKSKPNCVRGGILADDMGLGKSLTVIALILSDEPSGQTASCSIPSINSQQCSSKMVNDIVVLSDSDEELACESKTRKRPIKVLKKKPVVKVVATVGDPSPIKFSRSGRPLRKTAKRVKYVEQEIEDIIDNGDDVREVSDAGVRKENALFEPILTETQVEDASAESIVSIGATGIRVGRNSSLADRFKGFSLPLDSTSTKGVSNCTLVVCTMSLLSNWLEQFETHLDPNGKVSILLYYGSERNNYSQKYLLSHHIVVTTYSVISSDYKRKSGVIFKAKFARVVLDEGHLIRNAKALMSRAVHSIEATKRWVLSGTPIQNSLRDMWSQIKFLRLEPFDSGEFGQKLWRQALERPVMHSAPLMVKSFKALISSLLLRRTKGTRINGRLLVPLPQKIVQILKVQLSQEERKLYDDIEKSGSSVVRSYFQNGRQFSHYAHILAILTRLRQLACHPALCRRALEMTEQAMDAGCCDEETRKKLIETLKVIIASGTDEECCVCLDSLNCPVITNCAHVFCRACIEQVIANQGTCPLCRTRISQNSLTEVPVDESRDDSSEAKWHSSSKLDALIIAMKKVKDSNPEDKSIIVSQFTSLLNLVEKPLKESGFKFVRLDGSMSAKDRDCVLASFKSDTNTKVLLLSMRAGSVGLNLSVANRLFLLDPAWNPAAEDQCFDRVHRLGQTKPVIVTKMIAQNTVEDKMLEIQDKKRKLLNKAFTGGSTAERREERIGDIRSLFGV